jgi:hypothetical protein
MTTEQTSANFGWEDPNANRSKSTPKESILSKDEWMSWKPETRIRLISIPYTYYVHQLKEYATDPKKVPRVRCSDPTGYERSQSRDKSVKIPLSEVKCPICRKAEQYLPKDVAPGTSKEAISKLWSTAYKEINARGFFPTKRWYVAALERPNALVKVCDIGPGIYKEIKKYADDKEDYGDPTTYDFSVKVNKASQDPQTYYQVLAKPKSPLSADDVKAKDEFDMTKLDRLCQPPTEEMTEKRVAWLISQLNKSQNQTSAKPEPTNQSGSSDSEMEFTEV